MIFLNVLQALEESATIFGLLGGSSGLIALFSMSTALIKAKAEARKAKAEAKKAEGEAKATDMDNMQKAIDSWKEIANERQEENEQHIKREAEYNAKIDKLYIELSTWRDKYNAKCEELTEYKIYKATNEIRVCLRHGCDNREPKSDY